MKRTTPFRYIALKDNTALVFDLDAISPHWYLVRGVTPPSQILGWCYPVWAKLPGWDYLPGQLLVIDYALQIKYHGGVILRGEIPGRGCPFELRPDQISDSVIFTRAVVPFRSGPPDWGCPFGSNTADWIRTSN